MSIILLRADLSKSGPNARRGRGAPLSNFIVLRQPWYNLFDEGVPAT